MRNSILCFVVLVIVIGCSSGSDISYRNHVSPDKEYCLRDSVLNDSYLFSWPHNIFILDSLIIIHDSRKQQYAFHIFNRYSGSHVADFGVKGRGPGEVLNVASVNLFQGSLVAYDVSLKKIVEYNIKDILSFDAEPWKEIAVTDISDNLVLQAIPIDADRFILSGNDNRMRYGIWNIFDNTVRKDISEYPAYTTDEETNWAISCYSASLQYNRSKRKLVSGTYIGASLEIYDVSDRIEYCASEFYYEPKYGYAPGTVPKWVTLVDDTVVGFHNIALGDDGIYGLLWGVESVKLEASHQRLVKFGYDGKPICEYKIQDFLESVAVSEDGDIYGMALDESGEFILKVYRIINSPVNNTDF